MKLHTIASLLTAPMLIASMTLAQSSNSQTEDKSSPAIALARCQYTATDDSCRGQGTSDNPDPDTKAMVAQSQFPRRMPRPPMRPPRPPMTHPRAGYPGMWMEPTPRHAAIGALIGFGLGAAAGAKANTDQHPGMGFKAALFGGGIGAMLGAVIGAAIPSFHSRDPYRYDPWPDEDEQVSHRDQGPTVKDQGAVTSGQ